METENKIYGVWSVSTEGDCEGRTIKNLGIYEGFIDEIALDLADKVVYTLTFNKIKIKKSNFIPKANSVHVSNILFDFKNADFENRPVTLSPSNYYRSVCITSNTPIDKDAIIKQAAIDKLTPEERRVLGIN